MNENRNGLSKKMLPIYQKLRVSIIFSQYREANTKECLFPNVKEVNTTFYQYLLPCGFSLKEFSYFT